MENPTSFDLNEAIRRWQENFGGSPAFGAENLEELASHLRASVERLKAGGLSEEEAFVIAARRIGEREPLAQEYAKVNAAAGWSWAAVSFWMVAGIYLLQVGYSLSLAMLGLGQTLAERLLRPFMMGSGSPVAHFMRHVIYTDGGLLSVYYSPPEITPTLRALLVVVLVARLAARNWMGFGGFVRSFERPVRTALDLVVLGLVSLLSPEVTRDFAGYSRMANDGLLAGMAAVNVVLVLGMVLLARRGLRKSGAALA